MTEQKANRIRVAIIATYGFEEAELVEARAALDNAGAKTTLLTPKAGTPWEKGWTNRSSATVIGSAVANPLTLQHLTRQ